VLMGAPIIRCIDTYSQRARKPKPAARDIFGYERQILTIAKLHLFAFSLVEGPYQTRATLLRWALIIFEETWRQELPDVPFEHPCDESLIIVSTTSTRASN
jgi:hypothetical protein